ncbi:hypothetical protein J3R30DRAFT_3283663 [Lentinula aciculospora]|uniref:Conserved oligomeric Golgi complex subunit 1 n=1 Tax=Lentinula aciculospora TaxID=153920 RepID=A0A9W9DTI1_9AGAR|nr:hypothetical protein J3R30DRAFT_3283663 [Lentinula aciculospora]
MASSAQRVIHALEDTKSAVLAQRPPSISKPTLVKTNEDVHLQALQVLAAHIKLLLDVPEHIWKMLEKKKYLSATWLYLLSRVVHRALVREEQDEEAWRNLSIDVPESFPLVQRQWEVVAQFRSQIVHKAVLSLRDFTTSHEETCATLLTLHLLDSRPLSDTLTVLLDQRSKSLHTIFFKNPTPRGSMREIKECILVALQSISQTMRTSRDVFQTRNSQLSLIRATLEFIQTDLIPLTGLPSELQLTTHSLLDSLPSSSHFSTLPQNLTSYKPHVDVNSQFSSLPPTHLDENLSEWFQKSTDALRISCQTWLSYTDSVKIVWSIRNFLRAWLQSSVALEPSEISHLKALFDEVCSEHIVEIWRMGLSNAETAFRDQLTSAVLSLKNESVNHFATADAFPLTHLFDAPSLPTVSQMEDLPLQKYRASLQRQLSGRVSLLDNVLKTLEKCAVALQGDLMQVLRGDDTDTNSIITWLKESYQPDAKRLCTAALDDIEISANTLPNETELDVNALVFVGRVVEELSSSSFVSDMSCDEAVVLGKRLVPLLLAKSLYDTTIDRWREFTVLHVLSQHRIAVPLTDLQYLPCTSPSVNLMQSLLLLAEAIQKLGFSGESMRHNHLADRTVHLFISRLLDLEWEHNKIQTIHDIGFLRKIVELWGPHWDDVCGLLDAKTSRIRDLIGDPDDIPSDERLSRMSADQLARTQTILAAILPYPSVKGASSSSERSVSSDKFAALLPLGVPFPDKDYRAAIEVAKPSSRFALLLVK